MGRHLVGSGEPWPPPGEVVLVLRVGDEDPDAAQLAGRGVDQVLVAMSPVTDTVKVVSRGLVDGTYDRELLWQLGTPVLLPRSVAQSLPAPTEDRWCSWLEAVARSGDVIGRPQTAERADPPGR